MADDPIGAGCEAYGLNRTQAAVLLRETVQALAKPQTSNGGQQLANLISSSTCARHYSTDSDPVATVVAETLTDAPATAAFIDNLTATQAAPTLTLRNNAIVAAGPASALNGDTDGPVPHIITAAHSQLALDWLTITRMEPESLYRKAFLTFLAAPEQDHWVNLRPDTPDLVLGDTLQHTEAGRVLLEADAILKAAWSDATVEAFEQAWRNDASDPSCPSSIAWRTWIEATEDASVFTHANRTYILDVPLTVQIEIEQGESSSCDTTTVLNETARADLQQAVENSPLFAELRLVHLARVAAEWYRITGHRQIPALINLVNSGDTSPWPTTDPTWDHQHVYDAYLADYNRALEGQSTGGVLLDEQPLTEISHVETNDHVYEPANIVPTAEVLQSPRGIVESSRDTGPDWVPEEIRAIASGYGTDVANVYDTTNSAQELINNIELLFRELPTIADESNRILNEHPWTGFVPGRSCVTLISHNRTLLDGGFCLLDLAPTGGTGAAARQGGREIAESAVLNGGVWKSEVVSAFGANSDDVGRQLDSLLLPAGSGPSKVVRNALEPNELELAERVVALRGGEFVGPTRRRLAGVDGSLNGVPVQLKQTASESPAAVLRWASQAEKKARKAGVEGLEVYVDAPNVNRERLVDFATNGPLTEIPFQGTVKSIYVRAADGWVVFPGR